jgi:hypothetical protein
MPLPKVRPGEDSREFINRCMSDDIMVKEYEDGKQRFAVCNSIWDRRNKMKEAKQFEDCIKIQVENDVPTDDIQFITISDFMGISAKYSINRDKVLDYYFDSKNENHKWTEDDAVDWYQNSRSVEEVSDLVRAKKFFKRDEEKKIVYGVALVPWEVDLQGDIETPDAVEEAAHNFMKSFQTIGEMHQKFKGIGTLLESYVAPVDFEMNGVKVKKGSWVIATKATDEVWNKIKNNELTGYSIGYEARRHPIEV